MLSLSIGLSLLLVLTVISCTDKKSKKQTAASNQKTGQSSTAATPLMPRSSPMMSPCQGKTSNRTSSKEKSGASPGPSPPAKILKPDVTQMMDVDEEGIARFSEADDEDNTVDDATSLRGFELDVPSDCLLVKGAREKHDPKSSEICGESLKKKPSMEKVVEKTMDDTEQSVREKRIPKRHSVATARTSLLRMKKSMERSRDMVTAVEKRGGRKERAEKSRELSRRRKSREIERRSRELKSVEKTKTLE